jgi:hypothetical protein
LLGVNLSSNSKTAVRGFLSPILGVGGELKRETKYWAYSLFPPNKNALQLALDDKEQLRFRSIIAESIANEIGKKPDDINLLGGTVVPYATAALTTKCLKCRNSLFPDQNYCSHCGTKRED